MGDNEWEEELDKCGSSKFTIEDAPSSWDTAQAKKVSIRGFSTSSGPDPFQCDGEVQTVYRVRTDRCTLIEYKSADAKWNGQKFSLSADGRTLVRSYFSDDRYESVCTTDLHADEEYEVGKCVQATSEEWGGGEMQAQPYWETADEDPEEEPVESSSSSSSTGAEDADTGSSSSGGAAGDDSTGSNAASSVNVYGGSMVLFMVAAVYLVL